MVHNDGLRWLGHIPEEVGTRTVGATGVAAAVTNVDEHKESAAVSAGCERSPSNVRTPAAILTPHGEGLARGQSPLVRAR